MRTIDVFLDECFDPLVGVCAVALDPRDTQAVNLKLFNLKEKVEERWELQGLDFWDKFIERGFHATEDPISIKEDILSLLSEDSIYKSFIIYNERHDWMESSPELKGVPNSPKARQIILTYELCKDLMRWAPPDTFLNMKFESAGNSDTYIRRATERAARDIGFPDDRYSVSFAPKWNPPALLLPDYVLYVMMQWATQAHDLILDPSNFASRDASRLFGSVSMMRALNARTSHKRSKPPASPASI